MGVLMWISHSERILQLDDLLCAIAVEIGSTDLGTERIPSVETLLSYCLGLVIIDGEALTIRLIHYTLQEYLSIANHRRSLRSHASFLCTFSYLVNPWLIVSFVIHYQAQKGNH